MKFTRLAMTLETEICGSHQRIIAPSRHLATAYADKDLRVTMG